MSELRDFVADLLEAGRRDRDLEPDGLEVLAPAPLRDAMGWPELARLGFGAERAGRRDRRSGLKATGSTGSALCSAIDGRWSERQLCCRHRSPPPGDPERVLERVLDLPNAVWRSRACRAAWTRCLMLAFRYTAVSDEKREGLVWLGFNLGTGAVLRRPAGAPAAATGADARMAAPDPAPRARGRARHGSAATRSAGARRCVEHQVGDDLEPFLRAMRRRLERDRNRDARLSRRPAPRRRCEGSRRRGARGRQGGSRPRRETLRVAAIEREYAPSSTTCATTTPCASRSNGCRRSTSTCRCSASRC